MSLAQQLIRRNKTTPTAIVAEISVAVEMTKGTPMKTMRNLLAFFILLVFSACTSSSVYEKPYSFNKKVWAQHVKPEFNVDIKDTSKAYTFVFTLRTTTEYKFSNLWVYLNTRTPNGEKAREPYEIKITDADGVWVGKKTGTVVETSIYFKNRKLPKKGVYHFVLEQGITETLVDEVLDISLLVEEVSAG
jgi:gliding motility-associated lipoprotein GldH